MPRNGAGVYAPPGADFPAVASTLIQSALYNDLINDMSTALSGSIAADGQTTVTANIPMAGFKITGLGNGSASGDAANYGQLTSFSPFLGIIEFRLTLTTGVPVTTSDVTAATTVYMSPYKGNRIVLCDSLGVPTLYASAQLSIAVPATTSTMYDVFCFNNSGVPALELLAWTNDTTRATALATTNGTLFKSGDLTRRYIGSFRTTTVSGQTEDSLVKRYVWNYYNRVRRPMRVLEATDSWVYSSASIRQANGSTANQLDMVIGVSEDMVAAEIRVACQGATAADAMHVGVGLDVTASFTSGGLFGGTMQQATGSKLVAIAAWKGFPGAGRHFLSWNEVANVSATATWYGDNAIGTAWQSGIHGEMLG